MIQFRGCYTAIVTPFTADGIAVDEARLADTVQRLRQRLAQPSAAPPPALETVLEGTAGNEDWLGLAVAFAAATATGFATVRWLLGYIATHRFTPFAWYRIGLGVALLLGLPAGG